MAPRRRRLVTPLYLCSLVLVVLFASLWVYDEYEAHRATSMLVEAGRVQLGDSEASVLPLVRRYGGFKWAPDSFANLGKREEWIDPLEYEHRLKSISEYAYWVAVNPWNIGT